MRRQIETSDFSVRLQPPRHRSGLTLIELLVVIGIIALLAALFLPATRSARGAARRTQCMNNLRNVGLALHIYHDTYDAFPPARTMTDAGRPLHGWRTQMLPFVDQASRFEAIDLSKPWDDPANAKSAEQELSVFRCPSVELVAEQTIYAGSVGPEFGLRPDTPRTLEEIEDGTSNTVMITELASVAPVPWMAPQDGGAEFFVSLGPDRALAHTGVVLALFADGSVRSVLADADEEVRRALVTVAGGEEVGEY